MHNHTRLLLGSGVAAAALLAGCGGKSTPAALPPITVPSASPSPSDSASASASASASVSASASASVTTSASSTAAPTTSSNLTVTPDVRTALLAAFVTYKKTSADQLTGPNPGSVYYAYLAPTRTYWAIADFAPSATSTEQTKVSMQDDGVGATFTRTAGAPWKAIGPAGGGGPYPCPGELDPELMRLWHLPVSSGCPLADGRAPRADGDVSFVNEGGSDAPSGTYQGLIDLEQVQLSGTGEIWLDAETVTPPAAPVNSKPLRMLDINVTKATRTEYSVGSDAASSHVVEGTFDAAFGNRVKADFTSSADTFLVTVTGGNATLIQEISAVTPTGPNAYSEP